MADDVIVESTERMLTTVDNPYSPFTEYDKWFQFDRDKGYNTCGLLGRIARSSHELSDADEDLAIELAMQEIVRENVYGVHRLVSRSDFKE